MDKRKSILNISISVGFKLATLVMALVTQRILIRHCGNAINGLNALYMSTVDLLAVAELGIGSAITFCMYKPVVEGDRDQVSALYFLLRKLCMIIGLAVLVIGLGLVPFIHHLAKGYSQVDENLQFTFVLMLLSSVVYYFFNAKTALINAHKNNYIATAISSGGYILQRILQIVALITTQSFTWYLISRIVAAFAQWAVTEVVTRKKYGAILSNKRQVKPEDKEKIVKSVQAMGLHKIGNVLVNTADNVIISAFIGISALGYYNNYVTLQTAIVGVLTLVFTSLSSVIGHLFVKEGRKIAQKYCEAFQLLNFLLGMVFFLGYYAVIDNLVEIFFGEGLTIAREISFVMAFNSFVNFIRQNTLLFRDATGTFYHDRWKSLLEGAANVLLSILFIRWLGIAGVIVAKIIANLLICHIIEPFVLYKHAFYVSPKRHYIRNYGMIVIFAVALLVLSLVMVKMDDQRLELLVNGCISIGISGMVCILTAFRYKELLSLLLGMRTRKKASRVERRDGGFYGR